jgi:hypothetical protein
MTPQSLTVRSKKPVRMKFLAKLSPIFLALFGAANAQNARTLSGVNTLEAQPGKPRGAGSSPAGNVGDVQSSLNSTTWQTSHVSEHVAVASVRDDEQIKGPNPYIDCRAYGCRAVNPFTAPATTGVTATCNASDATVTISGPSSFKNGDGVVFPCGARNSLTTPSAPTVTPSCSAGLTGTLLDVAGCSGSTSYSYKICAIDALGGCTAASAAGSTSKGNATLGKAASTTISTVSLSGNTVTVNLSSTVSFASSTMVVISGVTATTGNNTQNVFNGTFAPVTFVSGTRFTFILPQSASAYAGAPTAGTGGTVTFYQGNHITWFHVSGAVAYAIYGRTSRSYSLIGISLPDNPSLKSDQTYNTFDDFGPTVTTVTAPWYIPTTPPASATYDVTETTIVSGAGSISLKVANAPTTNGGGRPVNFLFDDAITTLTAANAAVAITGGAPVVLPASNSGQYVFNAPITLPSGTFITQYGNSYINAPIAGSFLTWTGVEGYGARPSFGYYYLPTITVNSGQLYLNNLPLFSQLNVSIQGSGGITAIVEDTTGNFPAVQLDRVQFTLNNGSTEYSNMGLVVRGTQTNSGSVSTMNHVLLASSQNGPASEAINPGFWFNNFGTVHMIDTFMSGKGIAFRPTVSGARIELENTYCQGCYMPFWNIENYPRGAGAAAVYMTVKHTVEDTTAQAFVANLGGVSLFVTFDMANYPASGNNVITGTYPTALNVLDLTQPSLSDGTFGLTTLPMKFQPYSVSQNPGFSEFDSDVSPAAPTCTLSSGGRLAVNTWHYTIAGEYPNGTGASEGTISAVCTVTTTSGMQTVNLSWPKIAGAICYNVYRGTNYPYLVNLSSCQTGTTLADNGLTASTNVMSNSSAGGPAGRSSATQWDYQHITTGYLDFMPQSFAPSNPRGVLSTACRNYFNGAAMVSVNSSGLPCNIPQNYAFLGGQAYPLYPDAINVPNPSTSGTTLTCTSCNFQPTDVGKEVMVFLSGCSTDQTTYGTDAYPAGTTIAKYISATQVTTSHSGFSGSGGCLVYGTNNDTAFAAIDSALASSAYTACPALILPAGIIIVDKPHFIKQPVGCKVTPQVLGGSMGGGFGVWGQGPGATTIALGNAFATNMATYCVNGVSTTSCFVLPANAEWHNLSFSGYGESLTGKTPGTHPIIEADNNTAISYFTAYNYGQESGSTNNAIYLDGQTVWTDHIIMDGFGTAPYQLGGTGGTFFMINASTRDYCGSYTHIPSSWTVKLTGPENRWTSGGCTLPNTKLIDNQGTLIASGFAANTGNGSSSVNTVIYADRGSTTQLNNCVMNGLNGNTDSNMIVNNTGAKVYLQNCNISALTAVNAYAARAGTGGYLELEGGNTLSGLTLSTPHTVSNLGKSAAGFCSGTAPASSTIYFYGHGPNITTTACATTVANGIVMDHAGTAFLLIATARTGGVNGSSGVATAVKNGAAQPISSTLGRGTFAADGAHSFTFNPGDRISCQMTTQAADTLADPTCTIYWY